MVPGAAGRVGNKRRLTHNDCTTELTSPGIPAASLHAVRESKCPHCFNQLFHISVACSEGILIQGIRGGTISLLCSGWEIGIDVDTLEMDHCPRVLHEIV